MKTRLALVLANLAALTVLTPQSPARAAPSAFAELGRGELVEWRDLSPESLDEARRLGLPILVNVGTMWCQPCREMSAGAYSDPASAAAVNDNFIPIKLDGDRSPDLAARFAAAMQAIRDHASLPITGFLTSDGDMFVADGYFAAADTDEIAGLATLALHVSRQYQDDVSGFHEKAEMIVNLILEQEMSAVQSGRLESAVDAVAAALIEEQDESWGGFGDGAKEPLWPALAFALERAQTGDRQQEAVLLRALNGLADGGIRDLLGGGFHRSTSDRRWRIPHFAKLTSVNAGLLEMFAGAEELTENPRFGRVASSTLDYLLATLSDLERGGFYQAQAPDLGPGDHGSTFTWRLAEIEELLDGKEKDAIKRYFDLRGTPRTIKAAPEENILAPRRGLKNLEARLRSSLDQSLVRPLMRGLDRLTESRRSRPQPGVDPTMYTSTNGIAAGALFTAGRLLGSAPARAQALRTVDRFVAEAFVPGVGFARGIGADGAFGDGLLRDQGHMALALLDAYELTGHRRYLERARETLDLVHAGHSGSAGGLVDRPPAGLELGLMAVPMAPVRDDVEPGANAAIVLADERLARMTGDDAIHKRARALARAFAGSLAQLGPEGATMARATQRILAPPPRVVVTAEGGDDAGAALATAALDVGPPGTVVHWTDSWEDLGDTLPPGVAKSGSRGDVYAVVFIGDSYVGHTNKPKALDAALKKAVQMGGRRRSAAGDVREARPEPSTRQARLEEPEPEAARGARASEVSEPPAAKKKKTAKKPRKKSRPTNVRRERPDDVP